MATLRKVTLKVMADEAAPFTLMIEPWGMTYELRGNEYMYVDIAVPADLGDADAIEVIQWNGGISVSCPGQAVTRDASGSALDRF